MNGNEEYELKCKRLIDGVIQNNPDKTYLKGFFNYMGSRLSYATRYNYLKHIVNFMNYNNKDVKDLDLDDYTDYLSSMNNKTTTHQINVYSGLKKFATYLKASQKTTINPMDYVHRPKFIERPETISKREKGFLEKKEIKQYLNTVQSGIGTHRAIARQKQWKERDLAIVSILLITGMRCSALYKLNIDDINFVNKSLVTVDKGRLAQEHSLTDEVLENIKEWIEKRKQILDGKKEDALFISNQKCRMDQSSISRVVKKYSSSIKGKNITPHKLRATYGTQLYDKTKDLYFVQECMGHSSPQVTEKYIRGRKNEDRTIAANIMSQLFD